MAGFLACGAHRERALSAKSRALASASVTSTLKVLIAFEQGTSHYRFAVGPRVTQRAAPLTGPDHKPAPAFCCLCNLVLMSEILLHSPASPCQPKGHRPWALWERRGGEGRERREGRWGSTEQRGGGGPLSPHCPSPSDACPRLHSPGGLLNTPGGVESSVDPHVTGGRGEAERAPGDDTQASGL